MFVNRKLKKMFTRIHKDLTESSLKMCYKLFLICLGWMFTLYNQFDTAFVKGYGTVIVKSIQSGSLRIYYLPFLYVCIIDWCLGLLWWIQPYQHWGVVRCGTADPLHTLRPGCRITEVCENIKLSFVLLKQIIISIKCYLMIVKTLILYVFYYLQWKQT
jgi:hypothetical protein